jgi:hypothetical protein
VSRYVGRAGRWSGFTDDAIGTEQPEGAKDTKKRDFLGKDMHEKRQNDDDVGDVEGQQSDPEAVGPQRLAVIELVYAVPQPGDSSRHARIS